MHPGALFLHACGSPAAADGPVWINICTSQKTVYEQVSLRLSHLELLLLRKPTVFTDPASLFFLHLKFLTHEVSGNFSLPLATRYLHASSCLYASKSTSGFL